MATLLIWLIFLAFFGPVILGIARVAWAALVIAWHIARPWDELPMTPDEFHRAQSEAEARRRALRELEIEQESWT